MNILDIQAMVERLRNAQVEASKRQFAAEDAGKKSIASGWRALDRRMESLAASLLMALSLRASPENAGWSDVVETMRRAEECCRQVSE